MKDLILSIPFGNFLNKITIGIPDEVENNPVARFFAIEGATRFFQNAVFPKVEKNEAIRLGLWPDDAKGNPVRPKWYKRGDIPFSKEGVDALEKAIGTATIPIEGKAVDTGVADVTVTENSDYSGVIAFLESWLGVPNKADGSKRSVEQFCEKRDLALPSEPWQDDKGFLASVAGWMASQD